MINNQNIGSGNCRRASRRALRIAMRTLAAAACAMALASTALAGTFKVAFNGPQPVQSAKAPATVIDNQSIVPVVTRSVDEAGRRPFQQELACDIAAGSDSNSCTATFVVPMGEEVVIEYVNVYGNFMLGAQPAVYQLFTLVGGNNALYEFFPGQPLGFAGQFTGSQMVHISADPGSTIRFNGWQTSTVGNGSLHMMLSGYTVSLP